MEPFPDESLPKRSTIKARAYLLAERINLMKLEELKPAVASPFTIRTPDGGYTILFRYGVAVFFDHSRDEEDDIVEAIREALVNPISGGAIDEVEVKVGEEQQPITYESGIHIKEVTLEALQVIAEILAKSIVLEHYESSVSHNVEALENMIRSLHAKGVEKGLHTSELLPQLASSLLSMHEMVGFVGISEKPDLLWDFPEQERLYARLEDEYEIRERHMALDRKVELIFRTSDTLLDMLQSKRTMRLEWYIVLLIAFEILLIILDIALHFFG